MDAFRESVELAAYGFFVAFERCVAACRKHDTESQRSDNHRCAAFGDQRQRLSGDREYSGHDSHVEQSLIDNVDGASDHQKAWECLFALCRHASGSCEQPYVA